MFADCDLSPLCLAHSFTVHVILLLLSELTQHEVSHDDSVAKEPQRMLNSFDPMAEVSFPVLVNPANEKKKRYMLAGKAIETTFPLFQSD